MGSAAADSGSATASAAGPASAALSGSATADTSASGPASADGSASPTGSAVSVTEVPHPAGASSTVPLARSPSQATVVSGSSRVMVISPTSPRWRAREAASLTSAHSSGGDFTSRRDAWIAGIADGVRRRPCGTPSCCYACATIVA